MDTIHHPLDLRSAWIKDIAYVDLTLALLSCAVVRLIVMVPSDYIYVSTLEASVWRCYSPYSRD